jgi:hypothetical protein
VSGNVIAFKARPGGTPDPLAEANRWLDGEFGRRAIPSLVVVIGPGEGHVLEALEWRAPAARVLALEPDPVVAARFLARRDWTAWFESGRLVYLVDPDYAGAGDAWRIFPSSPDDHQVLVDPALARTGGDAAVRAAHVLKKIVFGARANADARRRFAPRYLTNTLRNLPAIAAGHDVRALTSALAGLPAVIAAAGPSLDDSLADLRRLGGRCVLIALGTALRPLLDAGIEPPLAVGLDPGEANARHFECLSGCDNTFLVAESALDRRVTRDFDGRTFWFRVANHQPWPWLNEIGLDVGCLEVWGSVLTAAFQVAVLAGCDPIVMVGADLSYTHGRPHCRATTSEFKWARAVSAGRSLESEWRDETAEFETLSTLDVHGRDTVTSAPLQAFRDWMVAHAVASGRRVVNATGAGIFHGPGVEQASLRDVLVERVRVPPLAAIATGRVASGSLLDVAERVRDVHRTIDHTPAKTPLVGWIEFAGDGLDVQAVDDALRDAIPALENTALVGGGNPPQREVVPWQRLLEGRAVKGILADLPEATARLQRALSGVQELPPLPSRPYEPKEQMALLLPALELLNGICGAALKDDDLASPVQLDFGRTVIAGRSSWPDRIRWGAQLFEALVGRAWAPLNRAGQPGFLAAAVAPLAEADLREAPATSVAPSNSLHACIGLLMEWLLCVGSRDPDRTFHDMAIGLAAALRWSAAREPKWGHAALSVRASGADGSEEVRLPLPLTAGDLSRVLTGAVFEGATGEHSAPKPLRLATAVLPGFEASISLEINESAGLAQLGPHRSCLNGRVLSPEVLTDSTLPKSFLAATLDEARAIVTPFNRTASVAVDADGRVAPLVAWPEPIAGEVPWGREGGSLAWHGPNHRMLWRPRAGDPVRDMTLPFRPLRVAVPSDGLPIWCAFTGGLWHALPGRESVHLVDTPPPIHLHLTRQGVRVDPATRTEDGTPVRRRLSSGSLWRFGASALVSIDLDDEGQCTGSAESQSWVAAAYPYSNVVKVVTPGGTPIWLTCYYPLTVAWAGSSLLVCTGEGDTLFFRHLRTALGEVAA